MKWNWGTKLVIAMAIFMGFIFVLVYQCTLHDINLVEKDYYPKGIKYQDRLDEIANAKPLENQIRVYQEIEKIIIAFPEIHPDTGSITFFRPSDTKFDQLYNFSLDSNYRTSFPKNKFIQGKYLVKIYWEKENVGYYVEKPFYFN